MRRAVLLALFAATPAAAQDHAMHGMAMPGMAMPAPKPAVRTPTKPKHKGLESVQTAPGPAMEAMPGMDHAMPAIPAGPTGTDLPAGAAPAPPPPADHYADRAYPPAAMAHARHVMMAENGARSFGQVILNIAEYQVRNGRDGYRWDGEAWFGGDRNRLTVKSEGEGDRGGKLGAAEVQALYSRAIGPYFDLQAGVRHDLRPDPQRTYATIGVEGLAPYMFEVEAALFLSDKGDLLARVEGYYDQQVTQRLILQLRIELNLAAQDVPETGVGSGLSSAELGLRLRYEIAREFAPYVGLSYEARLGDTADYARARGEGARSTSLVLGVRAWF